MERLIEIIASATLTLFDRHFLKLKLLMSESIGTISKHILSDIKDTDKWHYERISIENRRFRCNRVSLAQNFR